MPSKLSDRLSWIRSLFILDPLIWSYTIVLGTLSLLSSFVDRDGKIQHWFARVWSRLILKTSLCRVKVTGAERLGGKVAVVYAVNHLSSFDIPMVYAHLPFAFRIMAKNYNNLI